MAKKGRPRFRNYDKSMTIRMSNNTFNGLKSTHENKSNDTWNEFLRLRLTKAEYMNKGVVLAIDRETAVRVRMSAFDFLTLKFKWSQFCCVNKIYRDNNEYSFNGFLVGLLLRGEK